MSLRMNLSRNVFGCYRAWCPSLPGCAVWGLSRKEAKEKLRNAVLGYIAHLEIVLPRELARLSAGVQT